MSLIPKGFINSVVAIGVDRIVAGKTEKVWIATGFLVSMQENNNQQATVYLVTNKHVFQNKTVVYIRFNSINGAFVRDYPVALRDSMGRKMYTEHPKEGVDIVAMQLNPNYLISEGAIWGAIDLRCNSLDLQAMMLTGVDEGCFIYALGFPMELVGEYKAPICRLGCISRVSDAFLNPQDAISYIVDVHTFPGNSGGPIISRPENLSLMQTPSNPAANLIGILSAYIPYKDVLISQQTQDIRMVQTENSGLTIVHPVDRIKEVVLLDWDKHRQYTGNVHPIPILSDNNEFSNLEHDGQAVYGKEENVQSEPDNI